MKKYKQVFKKQKGKVWWMLQYNTYQAGFLLTLPFNNFFRHVFSNYGPVNCPNYSSNFQSCNAINAIYLYAGVKTLKYELHAVLIFGSETKVHRILKCFQSIIWFQVLNMF